MVRENSKNKNNKKAKRGEDEEEEEVCTSTGVVQISNKEPVEFELSPNCSTVAEQADFLLSKINESRGELLGLELDGPMKLSAIFRNNIALLDHQVKLNPAAKYIFRFKLDERVEEVGETGPDPLDEMVTQLANEEDEPEMIKCENQIDNDNSIAPNSEEVIAPVAEAAMNQAADQTPEKCIAKGALAMNVSNLEVYSETEGKDKPIESRTEKIGGFSWQMDVYKVLKDLEIRLDLHIYCNEKEVEDRLWLCKVEFKLKCRTDGEDEPFYSHLYGPFYGFNSYSWVIKDKDVMEVGKKPDELKLEIEVCKVLEKSFPPLDTKLVVNMGRGKSETMLVNQKALANLSSYFRKLFLKGSRDKSYQKGTPTFEINESGDFHIHLEYFKRMIYAAMIMDEKELEESNMLDYFPADEIIQLGTKYDIAKMVEYCEKYLTDPKNEEEIKKDSKMKLLELADKHGLVKLKEHCLKKMSVKGFTGYLGKSAEIYSRLSKSTQKCLKAKLPKLAMKLEKQIRADKAKGATSKDFINNIAKALLGQGEASKARSELNAADERNDKNGDEDEEKQPKKEAIQPIEAPKGLEDVQIVGGIVRENKCRSGMKRKGEEMGPTDWPTITIEDPNDYGGGHGPAKKQQKTSQQVKEEVPNDDLTGPELNQMQPTTSAAAAQPPVNHGNQQYWWQQERPAEPVKMLLRERKRRNN